MLYTIEYNGGFIGDEVKVEAKNKYDAWDKAFYEVIPEIEGHLPFSAWVAGVTYKNGKHKWFKSFEGNPFGE